jgi:hypothetical protein
MPIGPTLLASTLSEFAAKLKYHIVSIGKGNLFHQIHLGPEMLTYLEKMCIIRSIRWLLAISHSSASFSTIKKVSYPFTGLN